MVGGKLLENGRRKGTEIFPLLDHCIDAVLHLRITRIGENGSGPQRAWSELQFPGHPGDHLSVGETAGNALEQSGFVVAIVAVTHAGPIEDPFYFVHCVRRAQIHML